MTLQLGEPVDPGLSWIHSFGKMESGVVELRQGARPVAERVAVAS